MDYTKILTRSFQVVWKHRALWLFGVILALFGGSGGGGGFGFPGMPGTDGRADNRLTTPTLPRFDFAALVPILIVIGVGILLFAIVVILLRFVSRGALIGLVNELEANQALPTVTRGFQLGLSRFWSLLGIAILVNLPLALFTLLLLGIAALPFVAALLFRPTIRFDEITVLGGMSSLLLFICVILFLLALGLIIRPFYEFFQRACVIENHSAVDSIREGFRIVRANLASVLVLYILVIAIEIAFGIIMFPITLIFLTILAGAGFAIYFIANSMTSAIVEVVAIAIPMILLLIFISGFYRAFESTFWTQGYLSIENKPPARLS